MKKNLFAEAIYNIMTGRDHSPEILSISKVASGRLREITTDEALSEQPENTLAWPVRATLTTDTPPTHIIGQATSDYLIPPVSPRTVLSQLGITVLQSKSDIRIPNSSAFTSGFKGEISDADDGAGTVSSTSFKSLNNTAMFDLSSLIPTQSPELVPWAIDGALRARDVSIESVVFGLSARTAVAPQGMLYKCTTGTDTKANAVVPTMTNVLGLQETVATAKCFSGNLAYLTSPKGARILRKSPRESGLDSYMLENDGLLCGYPVFVSDQVSDACGADTLGSGLIFGRWSDLCMVNFGAVLITVDKYSQARSAKLRIVLNSYLDIKGLQGTASTGVGTDVDEYALSFASMAIKSAS